MDQSSDIPTATVSIAKLLSAYSKAQGKFRTPTLNRSAKVKKNGVLLYETFYADLQECIDCIRGPLTENGLSFFQLIEPRNGKFYLILRLNHDSGEFTESVLPIDLNQPNQQIGSTLTYLKRYQISAFFGLAADFDDDANATTDNNGTEFGDGPKKPTPPTSAPPKTNQNSPRPQPSQASKQPPAAVPPTTPQGVPSGKPDDKFSFDRKTGLMGFEKPKPVIIPEVPDVDKSEDFVDEAFDDLGEPQTVLEMLERLVERQGIDEQGLADIIRKVTGLRLKPAALNTGQVERVITFIEKLYTKKA